MAMLLVESLNQHSGKNSTSKLRNVLRSSIPRPQVKNRPVFTVFIENFAHAAPMDFAHASDVIGVCKVL